MLEGAAQLSPLPTGLFLHKRALSLLAGAWPHDAKQDKGSIYPVKELETRKGPEAAKAHSPYLRPFGFWCSGLVSCRHKCSGLRAACLQQEVLQDRVEVGGIGALFNKRSTSDASDMNILILCFTWHLSKSLLHCISTLMHKRKSEA